MTKDRVDCLVVGAGPAGLTAAIYLARFRLKIAVIEDGTSRATLIPKTRNHAGFPRGIAGDVLLTRMREQASLYGVRVRYATVQTLAKVPGGFAATTSAGTIAARSILLATGIADRRPPMAAALHDRALKRGLLRYCPVCDGYEVGGQRVAVLGTGEHGVKEAEFLRSFTADVSLIDPSGSHRLTKSMRKHLKFLRVRVLEGPILRFALEGKHMLLHTRADTHIFAALYSALGADARSDLAGALGAARTSEGCLVVDRHQRTSVRGLYAAGDVVAGLNQISHAMGSAGVAAVTNRNDLAQQAPLLYRNRA